MMAWSMPNTGQWNPAMGMTPDINMRPYTYNEWSDMHQQNWQEWTQWQQQYTQWHQQYGEKYAQQYQTVPHVGNIPVVLPMTPAAPPPPPEEPPPPPPPHENNQPLFAQSINAAPTPVPPPLPTQQWNSTIYNNANLAMGISQPQTTSYSNTEPTQTVNSDALKKLTEEERLFDIQFQKWEEEIEKWRKENINHPDKEAYKEYEKKFESCRAQLMERRNQMKIKRANLLNSSQSTTPVALANKVTLPQPSPKKSDNKNYNQVSQNYHKPSTQDYNTLQHNKAHYFNKQHLNNPQTAYSKSNYKNIDPQDRYESYQNIKDNMTSYLPHESQHPASNNNTTSFLPTTGSSKIIPGLDLVHEVDKLPNTYNKKPDVIDITDDKIEKHQKILPQQPDYNIISKGINNILGDEKIMNILSMVRKSNTLNVPMSKNANQSSNIHSGSDYTNNQNNFPQYYDDTHQANYNNLQTPNLQNISHDRQMGKYPIVQNQDVNVRLPAQKHVFDKREDSLQVAQSQYNNRCGENISQGGQGLRQPMYRNDPFHKVPINQNSAPIEPLYQELSGQDSLFPYIERKKSEGNNVNNQQNPLPLPQWVEEPLFTPSIIVEYEHKPLRLKARDFIEPVHMFDYNHISKDSEIKKINFEKEIDELFPKRILWEKETDTDINNKLHFERRNNNLKEDYSKTPPPLRVDFERRRPDDRFEFRRRDRVVDDRDGYLRRDDHNREQDRHRDYKQEDYKDFTREDKDFKRDDRDLRRDDRDLRRDDRDLRRDDRDLRRDDRDLRRDDRDLRREDKDLRRDDRSLRKDDSDYKRNDRHDNKTDSDSRKRVHSSDRETDPTAKAKILKGNDNMSTSKNVNHIVMIDDLLEPPGREMRPEKIVIILRGPPGSGKSYLAKLIRDKEAEHGGTVRIMSIDDYFMQEGETEEKDPVSGKIIKKPTLKYEYDASLEESYLSSLKRAIKRSLTDGYFSFLIYDAVNEHLKTYADVWNYARQNGFQVYLCTMDADPQTCAKRNIHNRTLDDIQLIRSRFFPTPTHHIQLDPTTLLQSAAITDVHMEDVKDDVVETPVVDTQVTEVESVFTSKWEKMDTSAQLARLDGISKPLRPSQLSMEDYLQLDDWTPNKAKPGKKSVRWADLEERRQQEKIRAIGFVVGQTDWNRMTDPTLGSSALTQTKYIERVRRN